MTIQDWIDALLSGEYSQTKHRLRDKDGFCFLGVACDVKNPLAWRLYEGSELINGIQGWASLGEDNYGETHCLPQSLVKELGITEEFTIILSDMNDNGKTFAEIAERIKEYAEENKGAV